jgi:Kef-type K+ transport system membrane component KefB
LLEFTLALILVGGKAAGDLSTRLRQPTVIGKIVAGLILGPAIAFLVGVIPSSGGLPQLRGQLTLLSGLGVIWLLFLVGLETEWDQLRAQGRSSLVTAIGGVVVTMAFVGLVDIPLGLKPSTSLLVAVALAATSVSISAQALLEMGRLNSPIGMTVLGAAVIDDLIGLVAFSLAAAAVAGKASELPVKIGGLLVFGLIAVVALAWLGKPLLRWSGFLRTREAGLAVGFAMALMLGAIAESAGMAAITGAYVAGVALSRAAGEHLREGARVVVYAFFLPVFLVNVGISASGSDLVAGLLPGAALTAAAIAGKIIGCGLGAAGSGLRGRSAVAVGMGMIPRGEVSLVLAAFGAQVGLIPGNLLAAIVIAVVATSLVSPLLLRLVIGGGLAPLPVPETT